MQKVSDKIIDQFIDDLNEALAIDPDAISDLFQEEVSCNDEMAEHETIQVGEKLNGYRLRVLGLLNGLLGTIDEKGDKYGYGFISMAINDDNYITEFRRTLPKKEKTAGQLAVEQAAEQLAPLRKYLLEEIKKNEE